MYRTTASRILVSAFFDN